MVWAELTGLVILVTTSENLDVEGVRAAMLKGPKENTVVLYIHVDLVAKCYHTYTILCCRNCIYNIKKIHFLKLLWL